jgi:hypothetical protein
LLSSVLITGSTSQSIDTIVDWLRDGLLPATLLLLGAAFVVRLRNGRGAPTDHASTNESKFSGFLLLAEHQFGVRDAIRFSQPGRMDGVMGTVQSVDNLLFGEPVVTGVQAVEVGYARLRLVVRTLPGGEFTVARELRLCCAVALTEAGSPRRRSRYPAHPVALASRSIR